MGDVTSAKGAMLSEMRSVQLAATIRNKNGVASNRTVGLISVIDERVLTRNLLKWGLETIGAFEVTTSATVEEWSTRRMELAVALIVLCLPSGEPLAETQKKLAALITSQQGIPVVVVGDANNNVEYVRWILEQGARGYIATDLPLDVAFQAMRLVSAGGTYVAASCLHRARKNLQMPLKLDPTSPMFTARQAAVVDALRRGKANKTIAYELNMRESTVKVHVRNVMKKLKAKNRTEVAYITNEFFITERAG